MGLLSRNQAINGFGFARTEQGSSNRWPSFSVKSETKGAGSKTGFAKMLVSKKHN